MPMTTEEYVRRVDRLKRLIRKLYPDPSGDWDSNNNEWKWIHRRRVRAERRIVELPKFWKR